MQNCRIGLLLVLIGVVACVLLATLSGVQAAPRVVNAVGEPLADVTVVAKNLVTSVEVQTQTNDQGEYLLAGLTNDATYRVSCVKEGFTFEPAFLDSDRRGQTLAQGFVDTSFNFVGAQVVPTTANFVLGTSTTRLGQVANLPLSFQANGSLVTQAGFDLVFDPALVEFRGGTIQSLPSGISFQPNVLEPGRVRILIGGISQTAWASGQIGTLSLAAIAGGGTQIPVLLRLPDSVEPGVQITNADGVVSHATAQDGGINASVLGDFNRNGVIDVGDLQLLINVWLGVAPFTTEFDLNGSGGVDVGDIQIEVNLYFTEGVSSSSFATERNAKRISARRQKSRFVNISFSPGSTQISTLGFDLDADQIESVTIRPLAGYASSQHSLPDGRVRVVFLPQNTSATIPFVRALVQARVRGKVAIRNPRTQGLGADAARADSSLVSIPLRKKVIRRQLGIG